MNSRLKTLQQFLKEDPDDPFTRFALAREHLKEGSVEHALDCFEKLVERSPDYVGTYYHLGKLYEQIGRREDAISTYRRGIEEASKQREAHARSELQSALMDAEMENA